MCKNDNFSSLLLCEPSGSFKLWYRYVLGLFDTVPLTFLILYLLARSNHTTNKEARLIAYGPLFYTL